jgi:hypothetical protein
MIHLTANSLSIVTRQIITIIYPRRVIFRDVSRYVTDWTHQATRIHTPLPHKTLLYDYTQTLFIGTQNWLFFPRHIYIRE